MNNNPLVSIIVPIYNVEIYIRKCIQSLLNQTYNNYEIILVDDGSPDNCGLICDEFATESPIIKVLHLENGGVCRARNEGMKLAKGEYFCFVDSDDWVEEDYLKDFVDNLDTPFTMVVQDAYRDLPNEVQKDYFNFRDEKYELAKDKIKLFKDGFFQEGFPWNKIFSSKIIIENNLTFDPAIKLGDDEKWNLNYYKYIREFKFISKSNYHYIYNPNSISNQARPFERELLRYQFRADYFQYLLDIENNIKVKNELFLILSDKIEEHFRICIFDRIYKGNLSENERINRLKVISGLSTKELSFLRSNLFFRNIDYSLLKSKKILILDKFKKMRLSVNG